jgi:TRAP-type C4-dicarboxylate transport system substrate-binding protein
MFQRKENRAKDAERLRYLKQMGMQVVEDPDLEAFRDRVADMKNMELFANPRVRDLLERILEATR